MCQFMKRFLREEGGAVTVDWVVLTAAMTAFGVGVAMTISTAAQDPAEGLGAALTDITIAP